MMHLEVAHFVCMLNSNSNYRAWQYTSDMLVQNFHENREHRDHGSGTVHIYDRPESDCCNAQVCILQTNSKLWVGSSESSEEKTL